MFSYKLRELFFDPDREGAVSIKSGLLITVWAGQLEDKGYEF